MWDVAYALKNKNKNTISPACLGVWLKAEVEILAAAFSVAAFCERTNAPVWRGNHNTDH